MDIFERSQRLRMANFGLSSNRMLIIYFICSDFDNPRSHFVEIKTGGFIIYYPPQGNFGPHFRNHLPKILAHHMPHFRCPTFDIRASFGARLRQFSRHFHTFESTKNVCHFAPRRIRYSTLRIRQKVAKLEK